MLRHNGMLRGIFIVIVSLSLGTVVRAVSTDQYVPLWPIYYRSQDAAQDTLEVLWPLWTSENHPAAGHRVTSVAWPLTRLSTWSASGDHNHYIFPFFWGANRPDDAKGREDASLAPDRYFFAVPVHWWWQNAKAAYRIVPPAYDFRYANGNHNWGAFPLLWRSADKDGTFTVLVPAWFKSYPLGLKSGGIFPLAWIFNHKDFKCYIAVPAWYAKLPGYKTYGAFPLFWHNRNAAKRSQFTNVLLLAMARSDPNGYSDWIWPLVNFSLDKKKEARFQMIFPFFWGRNPEHVYACTFPFAWSWDRKEKRMDNWSLAPLYWHFRNLGLEGGPFPIDDLDALFPIYGRNRGPGKDRDWSFLAFPLYVHARQGDDHRYFVPFPLAGYHGSPARHGVWMFPIFNWGRDTKQEKTDFSMLLGYLTDYSRSPKKVHWEMIRYSTILPALIFIDKSKDNVHAKLTVLYEYQRRNKTVDWNILYFLAKAHRSEHDRWFKILSEYFFSIRKTPIWDRHVYTPLYWDRKEYPRHKLEDLGATCTAHTNVLFPISYYARRPGPPGRPDRVKYSVLDPLGYLRDDEDVRRHYSALLHLVDYKRRDDDSTEFRLLWRAFHRTVAGERRSVEMFPFIDAARTPDSRRFSFGWRLFSYEREGQRKSLRLFFLPAWRWGG